MKLRNLIIILIILPVILSALNCRKKDNLPKELPSITSDGKNTFGFKLNGEIWLPYYRCFFYGGDICGELSCDIANIPPSLNFVAPMSFGASQFKTDKSFIHITAKTVFLNAGDFTDSITVNFFKQGLGDYSLGNRQVDDKFIISKIDTVQRIFSGIFEFTLKSTNGSGQRIKITEGRFDFKYPFCKCSK